MDDLVYHCVGVFKENKALNPIEKKWIEKLANMGNNTDKLVYEVKE